MSSAEDRRAERETAAAERKAAREKAAAERKAARASSSVASSSEGGREKGRRERPTAARERPAAREKAAPVGRGSAVGQSTSSSSANKQRKAEKATAKQQEAAKRDAYHDSMRAIDGKDKSVGEGGVALAPTTPAESASQRMKRLIDEERLQQIAARRRAATEESSFIQRQMARGGRESDLRSQYEQMRPFQLRKLCAEQGVNAAADADKNTLTDLLVQAASATLRNDTPERQQAVEQTPEILAGSKAQPDFAEQAPVRPESRPQLAPAAKAPSSPSSVFTRPVWAPRHKPRRLDDDPAWLREAGYLDESVPVEMTLLADEFTDVAGEAGTDARVSFERKFRMELAAKLGIAPDRILVTAVGPEVVDQSSVDSEHGGPEINEQGGMERSI